MSARMVLCFLPSVAMQSKTLRILKKISRTTLDASRFLSLMGGGPYMRTHGRGLGPGHWWLQPWSLWGIPGLAYHWWRGGQQQDPQWEELEDSNASSGHFLAAVPLVWSILRSQEHLHRSRTWQCWCWPISIFSHEALCLSPGNGIGMNWSKASYHVSWLKCAVDCAMSMESMM